MIYEVTTTKQADTDLRGIYEHTKMRNVAGIAQTEAQKSSDMFAKCQYLDDVICCEL